MPYNTVGEMINDVASFYNDTDAINYNLPESTRRRILHYMQRTLSDIWYHRPWTFRYSAVYGETPTSGNIVLPYNFAGVGRDGGLFEADSGIPWAEIAMQEMLVIRSRTGVYTNLKKYAIGYPFTNVNVALGYGGDEEAYQQYICVPDVNETRSFNLFYETTVHRIGWNVGDPGNPQANPPVPATAAGYNYNEPIPLPESFHNCLFLGTVAKLQESKGDPKAQVYKSEFIAALSKQAAQNTGLKSRMQQMPLAVGGQW